MEYGNIRYGYFISIKYYSFQAGVHATAPI